MLIDFLESLVKLFLDELDDLTQEFMTDVLLLFTTLMETFFGFVLSVGSSF